MPPAMPATAPPASGRRDTPALGSCSCMTILPANAGGHAGRERYSRFRCDAGRRHRQCHDRVFPSGGVLQARIVSGRPGGTAIRAGALPVALEVLHLALVLLGRVAGVEGSEVLPP